ncbi:MAG: ribonuclease R [Candidatus Azambacteria bacterium]|nr:ribonuclease R [Candidatus Azambacteria bacterium]
MKMKARNKKAVTTGVISITSMGTGYVASDEFETDILIESQFLNTALHNDTVEFVVFPQMNKEKLSGEIIRVLERAKKEFVGTIDKGADGVVSFVVPDDKRMYKDIAISPAEAKDIQDNTKVLVEITRWDNARKNPEGRIVKVLGAKGDNNVEMESIVLEKGFQVGFPPKVEREAEALEKRSVPIPREDIAERRDFRDVITFTIDPDDAKDFDDALSFKIISDDVFEVGVHIADVSHYVRRGTALDDEALERGVSIYLVDRTIPMLPEALSNDICSLNPQQDKLTFSAVVTMSGDGHIKKVWLGRTIINSDKRFAYEGAQKVLDEKGGEYYDELNRLNVLAKLLRKKRMQGGAVDFEKEEVKFQLDAQGKPLSVAEKPVLDAHKLIEEFMILANKEVATYLSKEIKRLHKGGSIYRTHDVPKKESVAELLFFLRLMGHTVKTEGESISSKELNEVFRKIKDTPEESLVKTVAMRSMAKAVYSIKNIGHYGLALENYTHFTSPIRRYADLLVHRVLEKHLHGKYLSKEELARYCTIAEELSRREIDAADAERSSIAYKQVEYMLERVGNIYTGVISGITAWGVYVEEEHTKASGMVKFKDMKDDMYVFNKETYSLVGKRKKKKYSIGDVVKIKIVSGDLERKTLDYIFA